MPATSILSLTANGTPHSAPRSAAGTQPEGGGPRPQLVVGHSRDPDRVGIAGREAGQQALDQLLRRQRARGVGGMQAGEIEGR